MRKLFATCFFVLFAFLSQAHAQISPVILPNGCGTANFYTGTGYLTMDHTGVLCTSSSGGGGGGGNVNVTQWDTTSVGAPTAWGAVPSGNVIGVNANVLASVLPTNASTSANQTNGTQKSQVVDASGNVQNAAIAPTVSTAAEASHVIKASAGQVQGCYAVNLTGTPGFLILLNAASAPADGAVTPLAAVPLPANGSASISPALLNPMTFSAGIVAVLTSATTPFTKTTGVITGYLSCQAI